MTYEPLHHKYRPQTFAQLVGQEAIAATLSNAMLEERIAPAYLLTGPRGTGKTSSARILAKSLNCLRDGKPTPTPCGQCEVCREIARGAAMDIVEIDAASNTGVDNIREIIERAQFAPVRCRYKVYVIDECLTGEARILTREGSMRLDNPELEGKEVLSYNEEQQVWEFKRVLRWLERGEREILSLKTSERELRCTGNHLIRTETGWQEARSLQPGMQILSPAPALARGYFLQRWLELARLVGYRLLHLRDRPTYSAIDERVKTDTPHWQTALEPLEEVSSAGVAPVYDLEVEDNHNFVANGLLVHNCHMLSTAAFNALLKTLEEPPPRVIFVLATTDPQRVLNTIISRCQRFDFRRIPLKAMVEHLTLIADKEAIEIEGDAISLVAQLSNGGLRDAESTLDQLSLLAGRVTVERVWELVGAISERDLLALLNAIATDDPETVLESCRHLMDKGREPLAILQSLANFYLNLLIARTSPQRSDLISVTAPTWEQLRQEAQRWETSTILQGQQHLKASEVQIKNSTQPRLWLEVTLLGLLPSALVPAVSAAPQLQSAPISPAPKIDKTALPMISERGVAAKASENNERTTAKAPSLETASDRNEKVVLENAPVETANSNEKVVVENAFNGAVPEKRNSEQLISENTPVVAAKIRDDSEESIANRHRERVRKIWERVLAALPDTVLYSVGKPCKLLDYDLDDCVAYVSVDSQNFLRMAESRRSHIEAAFEKIFQEKFKVNLQVGTGAPPTQAAKALPTRTPLPSRRDFSPPPVASPPPQPTVQPALESPPPVPEPVRPREVPAPQAKREESTVAIQKPAIASPKEKVNWENVVSSPPIVEEEPLITETDNEIDEEVMNAARELAQLLEGEIIRDSGLGSSVMVAPVSVTSTEQSELESLPLAEEEEQEEEDDDLPF